MIEKEEIDIDLVSNYTLFEKIRDQKTLFIDLFSDLSNQFPQDILLKSHKNAKGSKVSQGENLNKSPYQVLDIVRDFDVKAGYNIRVLNWWGYGLYLIFSIGEVHLHGDKQEFIEKFKHKKVALSSDTFDYINLFSSSQVLRKLDIEEHLKRFGQLVLYEKIDISGDAEVFKMNLLEKIKFILNK